MQALSTAVPGKWYTSTGGAGKIKGIQNQRGQRNPCDPE